MLFERAKGGRQDLDFDGTVPIYANRVLVCQFLHELVFTPGHSNVLEDFLWHSLSCLEMGAELNDWSVYKAAGALDLVEQLLVKVAANGAALLTLSLGSRRRCSGRSQRSSLSSRRGVMSAGRRRSWRQMRRRSILGPSSFSLRHAHQSTNLAASTDATIDLAQAMAVDGLAKMRDPKITIADWLTSQDGSKSLGKNAAAHTATVGAHPNNDRVETNFGGFDHVLRTFESICIDNASGIAQQMRMHHFDSRTDHVVHDRRKAKGAVKPVSSSVGFFDSLSEKMQEAGVEMARLLRSESR
eukprot:3109074-Prymnesium_polylepis.2